MNDLHGAAHRAPGPGPFLPPGRRGAGREGFALGVVVLLLFAIGVAGATGYQVVRLESQLAHQTQDGSRALAIAHAGLTRFMGEHAGNPPDTVRYQMNGGEAVVTARRIVDLGAPDVVYMVTSRGTFVDPRFPDTPATRVVRQMANKQPMPFTPTAALANAGNVRRWFNTFEVDGRDRAKKKDCPEAGNDIMGIGATGWIEFRYETGKSKVTGNPDTVPYLASPSAGLRWDALSDPGFEVEHEWPDWPDFRTIPNDSFPAIRVQGNFVGTRARSGRGVLLVTGWFRPQNGFDWDGIILAGKLYPAIWNNFTVRGTLVGGFAGGGTGINVGGQGKIEYHSCNVIAASRALSYLNPLPNTWIETF